MKNIIKPHSAIAFIAFSIFCLINSQAHAQDNFSEQEIELETPKRDSALLKKLKLLTSSCKTQSYIVKRECNEDSSEVTYSVTSTNAQPAACLILGTWIKVVADDDVLVETRQFIKSGKTHKITIPTNKNLQLQLGLLKEKYLTVNSFTDSCGQSNRVAVATYSPTPTPTATDYYSEEETIVECNIDGPSTLACESAVTNLQYTAYVNLDYCNNVANAVSVYDTRELSPCFYYRGQNRVISGDLPPGYAYSWKYTCDESTQGDLTGDLDSSGVVGLDIALTSPAEGKPTTCKVGLQITYQRRHVATCYAQTDVQACSLDCNQEINGAAVFDECGVCGGDGSSCVEQNEEPCTSQNIFNSQILLDGSARRMSLFTVKAAKLMAKIVKNDKRSLEFVERAEQAHIQAWSDVWSVPSNLLTCSSTNKLCANVSLLATIQQLSALGADIKSIGEIATRVAFNKAKNNAQRRRARKLRQQIFKTYKQFQAELDGLPNSHAVCNG